MILYHASTAYHVLCCMVHKLAYHKEDEAIFMIVEHMMPKEELGVFIKKMKNLSTFREIITVPEGTFRLCHGKTLNLQSTERDILDVIRNICGAVDNWYTAGFHQFEEIYLASDQWSVGVYLLYHNIPYHYFEDASGMLGDEERYLSIIRDLNLTNYVICNYLRGVGRNEVVVDKLCDIKNQPVGFFDEKAVDFSIYHLVSRLPSSVVDHLLALYGAKQYSLEGTKKVAIYMTQFLRTLTIKNLEIQESITTLLLDYFAEDCKVIIKPHPKDRWIDYNHLLPYAEILDNYLPSELLPFVLKGELHLVLTASSTSIGGMSHMAKNIIGFGTDIEVHYDRLHELYVLGMIINKIYMGHKIVTHNMKRKQLNHFLSKYPTDFTKIDTGKNVIYIDGGQTIIGEASEYEKQPQEDVLIFLNSNQKYDFLLDPKLNQINFIVMEILILSDSYGSQKEHENSTKEIWIYCEKEEERRKILEIQEKKILKYSKLEIEISSKEATLIMILEGKMKAMQYALQQKENEEQNQVLTQIKEVIRQYQEEEITKRILLEEEGILHE